ncbi:MAG: hypothetical protein MJA29_05300 [Candidatus Omnitrophica bacterium]|nr:hypothetical protein [Candidatus Omnitrophota bacterium]
MTKVAKGGSIRLFVLAAFLGAAAASCFLPVSEASAQEPASLQAITLDVQNMELTDVLRMIADQSGLNLIASKNVKGLVTISLQDVPVEKALDAILNVNNCGYIKEDNIIQVYTYAELSQKEQFSRLSTRVFGLHYVQAVDVRQPLTSLISTRGRLEVEPKTNSILVTDTEEKLKGITSAIRELDRKMETRAYRLSYADPAEVQKKLTEIIPEEEGDMLIDERTNSVIVTSSVVLLDKIDALIGSWDRRIPQVLIEAKIMQLTLDRDRFIGVDWQFTDPSKHTVSFGPKDLPLPSGISTPVDVYKIGVLASDDYEITIKTLQESDDVELISSPRIVTLDNTEAKILIGASEPYEIFYFDSEGRTTGKDLKFVEVGIKLIVTPKIADDGFITMHIHPEVSSARTGTATDALAVDTTEASTMITVRDGNTVVLGGLIKDDHEKRQRKIPLLGDIPLIKYAFRNDYVKTTKKEIVIFITPRIIDADQTAGVNADNEWERRQKEMRKAIEAALY